MTVEDVQWAAVAFWVCLAAAASHASLVVRKLLHETRHLKVAQYNRARKFVSTAVIERHRLAGRVGRVKPSFPSMPSSKVSGSRAAAATRRAAGDNSNGGGADGTTKAPAAPLLSVPIPGTSSARFQVPSPSSLAAVVAEARREAGEAGLTAIARRTIEAQAAVVGALTDTQRAYQEGESNTTAAGGFGAPDAKATARYLRRVFERLGTTYIKLGQFIASSPTLFPAEFVTEFQQCLDKAPAVPFETIKTVVEEELGCTLGDVFSSFDGEPLATASVAQVHAATDRLTGRRVVVKVQKPGIAETLKADLAFLNLTAQMLEAFAPDLGRISLANVAADLRESTLSELDFTQEARNLDIFAEFLAREELDGTATCPEPLHALTTRRVLTMTRVDGVALLDAAGQGSGGEAPLVAALQTWARSIEQCEFFHADVHNGNLLLQDDGRVAFIDFGIVGRLPPRFMPSIQGLRGALTASDMRGAAEALVSLGVADGGSVDVDALAGDLEAVLTSLKRVQPGLETGNDLTRDSEDITIGNTGGGDESDTMTSDVTRLALDVVQAADRNGLTLPREFGLLVKQALYFDRYLQETNLNLLDVAMPQDGANGQHPTIIAPPSSADAAAV